MGGRAYIGKTNLGVEKGDFLPEEIAEFMYELSKNLSESKMKFQDYIVEKEDEFDSLVDKYKVQ